MWSSASSSVARQCTSAPIIDRDFRRVRAAMCRSTAARVPGRPAATCWLVQLDLSTADWHPRLHSAWLDATSQLASAAARRPFRCNQLFQRGEPATDRLLGGTGKQRQIQTGRPTMAEEDSKNVRGTPPAGCDRVSWCRFMYLESFMSEACWVPDYIARTKWTNFRPTSRIYLSLLSLSDVSCRVMPWT